MSPFTPVPICIPIPFPIRIPIHVSSSCGPRLTSSTNTLNDVRPMRKKKNKTKLASRRRTSGAGQSVSQLDS